MFKFTGITKNAKATYHAPESDRAQEIAFDHAMLPKKNYVYTDTTFTAGKPSAIKTIIGNKAGGKLKLEKFFNGKMQAETHDMNKEELDRYTAKHMLGDSQIMEGLAKLGFTPSSRASSFYNAAKRF